MPKKPPNYMRNVERESITPQLCLLLFIFAEAAVLLITFGVSKFLCLGVHP